MLYAVVAACYAAIVIVFIIGARRRRIALLVVGGLLTVCVTGLGFVIYPMMVAQSGKDVSVTTQWIVGLDGDPRTEGDDPSLWAEDLGDSVAVFVEMPGGEHARRTVVPKAAALIEDSASSWWHNPEHPHMAAMRPRLITVSCQWRDPLVELLEGSCAPDDRRTVLQLPNGKELLE